MPEPIVTETTTVFARLAHDHGEPPPCPPGFDRLGSSSDDEPPPLPPVPARGSQQYAVPRVQILNRVVEPHNRTLRPVPRRTESHTPPIELDAEYEALLRQLG